MIPPLKNQNYDSLRRHYPNQVLGLPKGLDVHIYLSRITFSPPIVELIISNMIVVVNQFSSVFWGFCLFSGFTISPKVI